MDYIKFVLAVLFVIDTYIGITKINSDYKHFPR